MEKVFVFKFNEFKKDVYRCLNSIVCVGLEFDLDANLIEHDKYYYVNVKVSCVDGDLYNHEFYVLAEGEFFFPMEMINLHLELGDILDSYMDVDDGLILNSVDGSLYNDDVIVSFSECPIYYDEDLMMYVDPRESTESKGV